MSLVRVHNFSISLDGFGTGEGQQLENPFGHAGSRLMEWAFGTRTFRAMGLHGESEASFGVDEAFASQWGPGIGAEIMGRNKLGPQRGPWEDEEWKGWWGDNPVFHTPVVVLTHHPRPVLEMAGGTTFHFVDADPVTALKQARALAGDLDVRIVLGRGERLWDGLEGLEERFEIEATPSPSGVSHLIFTRRSAR
jgi:dihydrofolate reductase